MISMPNDAHMRQTASGDGARDLLLRIRPHIDVFPIRIEGHGTPSPRPPPHTSAAAQIVSSPPSRASVRPVASSTRFISAARARASSTRGNCHPAGPARRNAPCAPVAGDGRAFADATPQSRGPHPPPQRVVMDGDAVFARQMLGGHVGPNRTSTGPLYFSRTAQHTLPFASRHHSTRDPRCGAHPWPLPPDPPRQTLRLAMLTARAAHSRKVPACYILVRLASRFRLSRPFSTAVCQDSPLL